MATKVTFSRGEAKLRSVVSEHLDSLGFVHLRDLLYGRWATADILQRIAFGARHGKGGEFRFSFGVGVRFEEVEKLLPPGDDPFSTTVSAPLSVLDTSAIGFPEWSFDGSREPSIVGEEAVSTVVRLGLPFLEKYSDRAIVMQALRSENPRDWFTLTPEQRIATLAAMEYAEGRIVEAIERLHAALEERRDLLPSKRKVLQQLLSRLETKSS